MWALREVILKAENGVCLADDVGGSAIANMYGYELLPP